jgi:hypothetical protein
MFLSAVGAFRRLRRNGMSAIGLTTDIAKDVPLTIAPAISKVTRMRITVFSGNRTNPRSDRRGAAQDQLAPRTWSISTPPLDGSASPRQAT